MSVTKKQPKMDSTVKTIPEIMNRILTIRPVTWGDYFFCRSITEGIVGSLV